MELFQKLQSFFFADQPRRRKKGVPNNFPTLGSRSLPTMMRRRGSIPRRTNNEKQEFFRKFSPLSSSDMLMGSATMLSAGAKSQVVVLDPTGANIFYWLGFVSLAFVYFAWTIAVRVAFPGVHRWMLWLLLDALFHAICILDVAAQMRTSYLQDGILENDLTKLREHYMRTYAFKLDALAALPLDWLFVILTWQSPPALLHCFKLLKLYRLLDFAGRTESRSHFPNVARVVFLMHNLLVIIHWNACLYFLLSSWIGFGSDSWVYPAWETDRTNEWGSLFRQYIYCFYWSTLTLTTIGELPGPVTNFEYLFVTIDYLVGILMFATLVGNVGSIISNTKKNRTKFQTKMDQMKNYMKHTGVPDHLQERVIKWFDYLWNHGHPVDDQHVLNSLPDKLKGEIGMHVHFETLKKVDFFEECEQGALWEIVIRLRTQVYSPGEFVCRKGEVGREMYIVNSGRLEVTPEEGGVVVRELSHGEYFGEISVLNLGQSHHRRTAFVRSVGYTHLLCLSQTDLLEVLQDYPRTLQMLEDKGRKKLGLQTDMITEDQEESEGEEDDEKVKEQKRNKLKTEIIGRLMLDSVTDSEESFSRPNSGSPPLELHSIADQVIDVNIRLMQVETTLKELVGELRACNKTRTSGALSLMKEERYRKISAQM